MINSASIPTNASTTERISFFEGLFLPKKQMIVETIITPPVTMGYCTDASTCIRAITSRKLAMRLAIPFSAPTPTLAKRSLFSSPCFLKNSRSRTAEITTVQREPHMEYPAALVFS